MTDTEGATPRAMAAASLHTAAESVRFGAIPLPNSINIWCHGVSRRDLLTQADRHMVAVEIRTHTAGTRAGARYPVVKLDEKVTGLHKTVVYLVGIDATKSDEIEYIAHNASCLDTCAPDAD